MMKTFIIALLIIYAFYYGGNILYDLFFKKEKNINDQDDDRQEISLENLAQTQVVNVDIEDVEHLTTTSSMEIDEKQIFSEENEVNTKQALETKYQEQQQEDKINNYPSIEKETFKDKKTIEAENQKNIIDIIKQAETKVQMVRNSDGVKLFKSTLYS